MHVVVTGSNGLVGSAVVRAAHRRGWWVSGVGRRPVTSPVVPDSRAEPDFYLNADLREAIRWTPPRDADAVIHAASMGIRSAGQDYVRANVGVTTRMLEWSREHGEIPFCFISTASIYYRFTDQYLVGEDAVVPRQVDDFSQSKLDAERLVSRYPGRWAVLRPKSVFGPGDQLLTRLVDAARRRRLPILTGPSPVVTEFTDVDVLADYAVCAVETEASGIYNVSNAEPIELYPFLFDLFERVGVPKPRRSVPRRLGMLSARLVETRRPSRQMFGTRRDIAALGWSLTLDTTRVRTEMGEPATTMRDGVDHVVEWLLANSTRRR